MQRRPPEVIGQHYSPGGIRTVIGGSQQASKHRAQAHHLEVVSIHHACRNLAWRAQTDDRKIYL